MESSPLDYVAQTCMDLTESLATCENDAERNTLISNHIKKVWPTVTSIDDFKDDLEWVNVSETVSLTTHCSDKVVVLDFWTYCCINCYHVLPDLAYLESLFSVDKLAVIGVHCAKFSNEKDTSNILSAVQRYGIKHPVVNDADSTFWNALGIRCWPTLLILGPERKPLFVLTGEGNRDELVLYVKSAIHYFAIQGSKIPLPVCLDNHVKAKESQILRFPSRVALNPFYRGRAEDPFLAISDTGHHRIVFTDCSGVILRVIGGPEPGFKDGKAAEAAFNSPQGLCWLSRSVVAVCDTGNHAVRALHLDDGTVELLAGNGTQARPGDAGGNCLGMQALSSPWDIVLYTTPDMDMSVRTVAPPPPPPTPSAPPPPAAPAGPDATDDKDSKEKDTKDEKRRVLLIACAGSHQIWALFLDNTIWWKYKTYHEGTCVCIAGSGAEAARNSTYPNTAAFAQPSGLALKTGATSSEMFIADSESSSIRRLALSTGQVSTLCGGDRNPLNLFAFGDIDDVGVDAKLQHPLDVAYCESTKTLYVADTYNHKIKKVDVSLQKVTTLTPTLAETTDPVKFNEPSGLSISVDGKYLYVADTNNHSIKILNLSKNVCHDFKVRLADPKFVEPENLILYKNDLFVNRKCGNLIIYFNVNLDAETKNVKFTPGAPQNWVICVRDDDNKDVTDEFTFIGCTSKGTKLPGRVEMKLKQRTDKTHYRLYLSFQTSLCDASTCFLHSFTIRSKILVRDSVKLVESYKITCKVNPINRSDKNDNK